MSVAVETATSLVVEMEEQFRQETDADQLDAEKAFKNGSTTKRRLQQAQATTIEGLEFFL